MRSASERFVEFLQKTPYHLSLSDEGAKLIASMPVAERFHPAGTQLIEEEESRHANFFITSGWAFSYKSMASGHRVVADLLQRHDFVSADSGDRKVHRSVQAATDLTTFEIDMRKSIGSVRLLDLMLHLEARNNDIATEHLANVSRRRPLERAACFFLEIAHRYGQAGFDPAERFALPFTQRDIADALGLTAIHTNRLLRQLRERALLRFQHWTVELIDRPALLEMTDFNPSYLVFSSEKSSQSR